MKPLTKLNPQLENFALGEVRVITWQSSDRLEIEGLLCLPVGYEVGKSYPLIVEPHGGPRSSRDLGFKPTWHYFSGEGFAYFAPNFRGGDGYGNDFATANYNDWGGGDYQDIMAGVDFLIEGGDCRSRPSNRRWFKLWRLHDNLDYHSHRSLQSCL